MSTGLEIAIEKARENDTDVDFTFRVRPGRGGFVVRTPSGQPGEVRLIKASGEVVLLTACPDELDDGVLFQRVVAVLKRHWRKGDYPQTTWWAG